MYRVGETFSFYAKEKHRNLNPVKALMVREPLAYEYSSYGLFSEDKTVVPVTMNMRHIITKPHGGQRP
jgi:hypothetical protein